MYGIPHRSVALQMTLTWLFVGDHNCIRLLLSVHVWHLLFDQWLYLQMTLTWLFVGDHNCIRLLLTVHVWHLLSTQWLYR